ncbi:D-alanyl-D-alanine carboxypeptidase/D-alanyl-D-alanine-endopeptidase [Sediminibacterium soli]|uniref:D-alanyl-D-alanine carboxypeptidase/D-alanyl-D-alanine-endopeptidase n=1 Tax=Sediminibacterium soli TaxID=2698829 RepID=UPI00137B25D5|nr:D-alanyl-D-alanine carboxypeptidase [Sediminibacterium soli]NCI45347.1 hypothetical protein [Sediminibacterium soli]
MRNTAGICLLLLLLSSCSSSRKLSAAADSAILSNTDFASAHIGISVYDPAKASYLFDHQGDKFFVPASNTKLLTCYAVMKYLSDSLPGMRYERQGDGKVRISPTADPTFLHPDFAKQPVLELLKQLPAMAYAPNPQNRFQPLGRGWAWDDYEADYMPERSAMPVYGNTVSFYYRNDSLGVSPHFFYDSSNLSAINKTAPAQRKATRFSRKETNNAFYGIAGKAADFPAAGEAVPFTTKTDNDIPLFIKLLADTLHTAIAVSEETISPAAKTVYSQPTDSMLAIMMHRSDNFFAEQSLLMVSNEQFGFMSDTKLIDTLLKSDYKDMPQKPKWVDGSGLSRYNLVSPQDFVWLLTKMKNEFPWKRITAILPTGGTGTLASYYKNYAGYIYAKTGSLSNHLALSGYLLTKKGRTLVFSVMVNAAMAPAAAIRKGIEKFLTGIVDNY